MSNSIEKVSVIGAGAMGAQIAMSAALGGCEVTLHDIKEEQLQTAESELHNILNRKVEKKRLSKGIVEEAFHRLNFSTDLEEAVAEADLVIEAVVENLEVKRKVFAALDEAAPASAILATNSSTIVSSQLAGSTSRADKVCNIHFFNPALVMELVEVVKNPQTSEETVSKAMKFAEDIGKTPILLQKEIYGFAVNRILNAVFDEAIYLLEEGVATIEEIDLACTKGLNYPIGPFKLMDLTGIDVNYDIRKIKYEETGEEKDYPQKTLVQKYEEGKLGKKSGEGFYQY